MGRSARSVYLDVCALGRVFDDQAHIRIRLETDAVQLIPSHLRAGTLSVVLSPVHEAEIGAIAVVTERDHLLTMLRQAGTRPPVDPGATRNRAEYLTAQGLGPADAAPLAFAEECGADFVTCDDRLLRRCRRLEPRAWVGTPVEYCEKETLR